MTPCSDKILMISPQSQKLDYIFDLFLLKTGNNLQRVKFTLLAHNFMG